MIADELASSLTRSDMRSANSRRSRVSIIATPGAVAKSWGP